MCIRNTLDPRDREKIFPDAKVAVWKLYAAEKTKHGLRLRGLYFPALGNGIEVSYDVAGGDVYLTHIQLRLMDAYKRGAPTSAGLYAYSSAMHCQFAYKMNYGGQRALVRVRGWVDRTDILAYDGEVLVASQLMFPDMRKQLLEQIAIDPTLVVIGNRFNIFM